MSGSYTPAKTFTATDTVANPGVSGSLDINTSGFAPGGEGTYRLKVTITDSQGLSCSVDLTSSSIDVRNQLTATAAKTDSTPSTATLTGSADSAGNAAGASLQWERQVGTSWVPVAGQTASTLAYSSFEADTTPTATTFTLTDPAAAAGTYHANLYVVTLRLHAFRTLNGAQCDAWSDGVPVKKVTGVDP